MALIAISSILSLIFGAVAWLILGDRIPPGSDDKLPSSYNILCYALMLVVPIYLGLFFIYSVLG